MARLRAPRVAYFCQLLVFAVVAAWAAPQHQHTSRSEDRHEPSPGAAILPGAAVATRSASTSPPQPPTLWPCVATWQGVMAPPRHADNFAFAKVPGPRACAVLAHIDLEHPHRPRRRFCPGPYLRRGQGIRAAGQLPQRSGVRCAALLSISISYVYACACAAARGVHRLLFCCLMVAEVRVCRLLRVCLRL